ncbi:MAG TPA: dipeptidase [Trebonia sp.]|jgi:acetylornithine deacetylase/succinyl-diaminopimelate desuccinylase-like protein
MDVRDFIAANAAEFSRSLRDWLSIPSVSADPAHHGDVRKSAQWLVDYVRQAGFPEAEIWETDGLPAVYAHWPAADPGAPRVLVYGHHDVQPAALDDGWDYEPFAPYEQDGKIFGRGASDDKGQVLFHVLGARAAASAALAAGGQGAPPVTLTLLIEGEEESGSPHFAKLLEERKGQLGPDVIVISDTTMWAADTPSICTGMRGLAEAEITVTGPTRDLHSGSFGGGVPNPAHVLASLLAGLHDENGRITLPGFYDDVRPLSDEERALLAKLPLDEKAWLGDAGDSRATYGEAGYSTLERIWARPTAEVNGLWGGHTGPGGKTIIPKAAHAKLSFRLVADQEPAQVVESLGKYLKQASPNGCVVTLTAKPGVRPCRSAIDSPAVAAARRAMERAFGREVLFTKEGGSGPEADLADILGAPLVFVAVGLDADRIHAPNEYVDLSRLLRGAESVAYLWEELAGADGSALGTT